MKCSRLPAGSSSERQVLPCVWSAHRETACVIRRSAADVQPVLNAIAKTAARLCGGRDAQIILVEGATLRLVAQHGSLRTTEP